MIFDTYFGTRTNAQTILEVYSRAPKIGKTIHRQLVDQEAYDTWHLAFYMKEILSYKRLLKKKNLQFADIPRLEKNLLMYLLMLQRKKKSTVVELGHSLFELLDGMELVDAYFRRKKLIQNFPMLKKHRYVGIDISQDLCLTSELLHPHHEIKTVHSVLDAPESFDILYDRNVTSYAFTTSEELATFINRSDMALMNLFVSKEDTFASLRLGKTLTYFSLKELVKLLDKPLFHLFGEKAPGPYKGQELSLGRPVIEGFFLTATQHQAEEYMKSCKQFSDVDMYFRAKNVTLTLADRLLEQE